MTKKMSLPELYAKRDKNQKYFAKLAQRQRALGDKIKADEKLVDSYTRRDAGELSPRPGSAFQRSSHDPAENCVSTRTRSTSIEKDVTGSLFGSVSRNDRSMRRNYTPFRCNCALRGYLRFSFAAERANR